MSLPNRRWSFSLRTLFVLVTLLACWLAYQVNWIRQRHMLLDQQKVLAEEWDRRHQKQWAYATLTVNAPTAPGLLWLFGEEGFGEIPLILVEKDPGHPVDEASEMRTASRLFPEATLIDVKVIRDATGLSDNESSPSAAN